jgi:hypothetical protein
MREKAIPNKKEMLSALNEFSEKFEGVLNSDLCEKMGLDPKKGADWELFFEIRDALAAEKKVTAKRGGPIGRTALIEKSESLDAAVKELKTYIKREEELYPIVRKWAWDKGYRNIYDKGRFVGSRGPLKNPDLVIIDYPVPEEEPLFIPSLPFEIITMEVKVGVPSTNEFYQALNYKQFSHKVYLVYTRDNPTINIRGVEIVSESLVEQEIEIIRLSSENGIGVMWLCKAIANSPYNRVLIRNEPKVNTPEPIAVNTLLSDYLPRIQEGTGENESELLPIRLFRDRLNKLGL